MGAGGQLRECSGEIKRLGLKLNNFLYKNGNLKEGQEKRKDSSKYTVEECLEELEEVRKLLWLVYNDNKTYGESAGYNID